MRKPRKQVLANTGLFHKMWRGHNREPVFEDDDDKRAYLRHIARTHKGEVEELLVIYGFGIMTNHVHETGGPRTPVETEDELDKAVDSLGHWMRNGHSGFGAEFNRRHKRQGKVAYDRPKTTEIEDERGVLEAGSRERGLAPLSPPPVSPPRRAGRAWQSARRGARPVAAGSSTAPPGSALRPDARVSDPGRGVEEPSTCRSSADGGESFRPLRSPSPTGKLQPGWNPRPDGAPTAALHRSSLDG